MLARAVLPLARRDPVLEEVDVEASVGYLEPVAAADGRQSSPLRSQRAPQGGDVHLEATQRLAGPAVRPELVDQALDRHHVGREGQQHGEQGSLLGRPQVDHPAVDPDLQGPERPEQRLPVCHEPNLPHRGG